MSKELAFLRAIIENPDDDAPRLVFADWLEEHGQPERAEFIRVQIKLSRLPDDDQRRPALDVLERRLWEQHEKTWLGPLRSRVRNWRFRRGFVEDATVTASSFLGRASEIFSVTPLRHLQLQGPRLPIRKLADCPYLERLSGLKLWFNQLVPAALPALLKSPHLGGLKAFDVSGNDLGSEGMTALVESSLLPRLNELDLGWTRIGSAEIRRLVSSPSVRGLCSLDLSHNDIDVESVEAIASSPHLAGLTSLGFSFSSPGLGLVRAITHSPCQHLRSLFLSESDIGDEGMQALASAPCFADLRELWVDDNDITSEGIRALAESPYLHRLSRLYLFNNSIGDEGVAVLAHSRTLASLVHIDLGKCEIGDAGVCALAESPLASRLTYLGLWSTAGMGMCNHISRRGAEALASSLDPARLTWLNLSDSLDDDDGIRLLRDRFGDRLRWK